MKHISLPIIAIAVVALVLGLLFKWPSVPARDLGPVVQPSAEKGGRDSRGSGTGIEGSASRSIVDERDESEYSPGEVLEQYVSVLLVTEGGQPASGVPVELYNTMPGPPLSRTSDENGVIQFRRELAASSSLFVGSERYGGKMLKFPTSPRSSYTLFLRATGAIEGRVSLPSGESVTSGWAFAWKLGRTTSGDFRVGASARPMAGARMSARIGVDGSFSLNGLEVGARYGVTAYGPGFLVDGAGEAKPIRPPADGIDITAVHAYGAQVVLEPMGQGTPVNGQLSYGSIDRFLPTADSIQVIVDPGGPLKVIHPELCWGTVLLGIQPDMEDGALGRPVVVTSNQRQPDLTVGVTVSLVGCEQSTAVVALDPLAMHGLTRRGVLVNRNAVELGELHVGCSLSSIPFARTLLHTAPCLLLALNPIDDIAGPPIIAKLDWEGFPSWEVSGIPLGRYTGRIRSAAGGWVQDIPLIVIRASPEVTHIQVPESGRGLVELRFNTLMGEPYSGSVGFVLTKWVDYRGDRVLSTDRTLDHAFARPPYVLPFVRSGEWVLKMNSPARILGEGAIHVHEGESVRFEAVLDLED